MCPLDTTADCVQLLRAVVEMKVEAPAWRRSRAQLLVEGVAFSPDADAATGTLVLDAYVRHGALCANQLVAVPGSGDHHVESISAVRELVPQPGMRQTHPGGGGGADAILALPDAPWCVP
jgi:AARP2CN (NUC121) domain